MYDLWVYGLLSEDLPFLWLCWASGFLIAKRLRLHWDSLDHLVKSRILISPRFWTSKWRLPLPAFTSVASTNGFRPTTRRRVCPNTWLNCRWSMAILSCNTNLRWSPPLLSASPVTPSATLPGQNPSPKDPTSHSPICNPASKIFTGMLVCRTMGVFSFLLGQWIRLFINSTPLNASGLMY